MEMFCIVHFIVNVYGYSLVVFRVSAAKSLCLRKHNSSCITASVKKLAVPSGYIVAQLIQILHEVLQLRILSYNSDLFWNHTR